MTESSKRIAHNTVALYVRTFVLLIISLYTSRVVLATLGVTDFAIYNLVGQFILTFSIVTGTLTIASQRFITFEIGKPDGDVSKVFSTSLNIHAMAAGVIILLCEGIGYWYIHNGLNIPSERTSAAMWLFQCSLIVLLLQFLSIPYTAIIIAYEHISAFAYIAVGESVLKLVAVLLLPHLYGDALIIYALLSVGIAIIIRISYSIYCNRKFPHISYRAIIDSVTFQDMFKFMGWNIFGNTANVVSRQLIDLLLNGFFVLSVNAARGIAGQVENAVMNFCRNIPMAFNPQITKAYAIEDYKNMISLIIRGAKFCFFLFLLPSIPIIFETQYVLRFWLEEYPDHTVSFVRLALINCMIISVGITTDTAIFATGRIMAFQLIVGILQLLIYPITWMFFCKGYAPESCYIISIVIYVFITVIKVYIAHKRISHSFMSRFFQQAVIRIFYVTILSLLTSLILYYLLHENLSWTMELFFFGAGSVLLTIAVVWGIGMTRDERSFFINKLRRKRNIES